MVWLPAARDRTMCLAQISHGSATEQRLQRPWTCVKPAHQKAVPGQANLRHFAADLKDAAQHLFIGCDCQVSHVNRAKVHLQALAIMSVAHVFNKAPQKRPASASEQR